MATHAKKAKIKPNSARDQLLFEAREACRELRKERAQRIPVRIMVPPSVFEKLVRQAKNYERTPAEQGYELVRMAIDSYEMWVHPYHATEPINALELHRRSAHEQVREFDRPDPAEAIEDREHADDVIAAAIPGLEGMGMPAARRPPFRQTQDPPVEPVEEEA